MKLKVTLTETYADPNPSIPHLNVVAGQVLDIPGDVPVYMANRIVELDGGEIVSQSCASSADVETEIVTDTDVTLR